MAADGDRRPNRLINETSPYLLQHAHNPVDWYPWGPEALERAKRQDTPILLSIGYAACHWCHVMEKESFEDPQIASLMNERFVCIKVDREERPDIDSIYMDAVQAMTGHGGWPMTVFLTPDGHPFFGGTYFPPADHHGLPSFRRVLEAVSEAWGSRRNEVFAQGKRLAEQIAAQASLSASADPLTGSLIAAARAQIGQSFDAEYGGFGGPPKFPQAPTLEFMLRAGAKEMVDRTLRKMALGGICDQVGGGFHRYSVDATWLVPHFEKMLYDNAQLARVYTHAWQASKTPLYRRIATETLEYPLREMRDPAGGFYSSEDADSEGVEGKFYVWDYQDFQRIAPEASDYYRVTRDGNFETTNILTAGSDQPPLEARAKLFEARTSRVRPGRDEKILTSWNGLVIASLAEGGVVFGREDFLRAGRAAAAFLLEASRSASGRLLHSYKDGRAKVPGLLEDYAFLTDGLFALWEATFEPRWLEECLRLSEQMIELFYDSERGGFFTTGRDHEQLIARQKEISESATPSPNGVASLVLQKLSLLTGSRDLVAPAVEVLRVARPYMERFPAAVPSALCALDFYLSAPKEIVIVGERDNPQTQMLLGKVWSEFIPNKVVAGAVPGLDSPLLEGKTKLNGAPAAYVCENYSCKVPTSDPEKLAAQLV